MSTVATIPPFQALIRFSTGRRIFELHALPTYGLCLLGALLVFAAVASGAFHYDGVLFANVLCSAGIVFSFAYAARWIGFSRIADPIEQLMLMPLLGVIYAFCSVILASTAAPLADPLLLRADMALFGIDRTQFIAEMQLSEPAHRFWGMIYNSFAYTPMLALVLLVATGRQRHAWTLLTALSATAVVSIAFIVVLPAYGTPPFPYEFIAVFDGARDGSLRTLDESVVTGLITFPSFHAAGAVILAFAFGWLGRWAIPLVVLNMLMFVSALIVGGHYVVDLIAGGIVGMAVLYISARLHRRLPSSISS